MKRMIVYFHGLNSSPATDKVTRLKQFFPNDVILAVDIDIDPEISINKVSNQINNVLLDDIQSLDQIVFVGTSMGAWLAAEIAEEYDCIAYLINPVFNPAETLPSLGIRKEIADKYDSLVLSKRYVYIFSSEDGVLKNPVVKYDLQGDGYNVHIINGENHRFNGMGFNYVMRLIKETIS